MDEIISFADWLKARRHAIDLTQAELADRVGCTTATIKKIEQDMRRPSKAVAERMAEALELPVAERMAFVESARGQRTADRLAVSPLPEQGERRALSNLPIQRMRLIGREQEVAQLRALLLRDDVGLVTLTGPGGTGKTRLALEVASTLQSDVIPGVPDGVLFVALAPLTDAALVIPTIAQVLGVRESSGQALELTLRATLRNQSLLLVLDNFEQVLAAAVHVAALLEAAPALTVLATSRAPLQLTGEHQFAVSPLTLPDARHVEVVKQVTQSASGALFIACAQAVQRDFTVTPATAPAIAEICRRLDGLPLAIELAAARVKVLSPPDLLQRLQQCLPLLTGGSRDLPVRQQTIRNTIDWSVKLLETRQQVLFRRLSVFVGGCTLVAAETVCHTGTPEEGDQQGAHEPAGSLSVVNGLQVLLDQSLVQHGQRETLDGAAEQRFTMLELVREYASEQLVAHGEAPVAQRRHAEYYLALAEAVEREREEGAAQLTWFVQLEAEHANLRAALQWALRPEGSSQETELALRLATALSEFWDRRGYLTEGRWWLEAVLATCAHNPSIASARRAKAMLATAAVALDQTDVERGTALYEEVLALFQELGDTPGIAAALAGLGSSRFYQSDYHGAAEFYGQQLVLERELGNRRGIASALGNVGYIACDQGDAERGFVLLGESLALSRERGDKRTIAWALYRLGVAAYHQGNFALAVEWCEESLALFREVGDVIRSATMIIHLGSSAGYQGDLERAARLLQEGLVVYRRVGDMKSVAVTLRYQGKVAYDQRDWERATALYQESLALGREQTMLWESAACMEGLAGVAGGQARAERAARLWGAAETIRAGIGAPPPPAEHTRTAAAVAHARNGVGDHAFAAAWAEGQAMTLEQAVAYALGETDPE